MIDVRLSFLVLKGNIVDNYELTKTGWRSKQVLWTDVYKLMTNSKIQYSPYVWKNGYKTFNNWTNDTQQVIVLDIDDGLSIPEFQKKHKGLEYILATTKSHQKLKKNQVLDRYRVMIPAINISHEEKIYFRSLELFSEDNDKQTLTKTASFLGNDEAIVIHNKGKVLDLYPYNEVAISQLEKEKSEKLEIDEDYMTYNSSNRKSVNEIKEELTFEVLADMLMDLGYELRGNKFKLREDERTNSATISYKSLVVTDYGDGWYGDIFSILMDYHSYTFREALDYVRKYV